MNFGPQMPTYIAYVITLVLLAAMIIAGIWFPARRAMKVEPANALKDQ
jgi:putative ABC transport system permease protein